MNPEEALKQGIQAHREGKLDEAERRYREILKSQPRHPDANHNLGLVAMSVNKTRDALLLFKTALESNPNVEQFWLSFIDALIKEKQFDNANQVIEQGKKQGINETKLNARYHQPYEVRLIGASHVENFDRYREILENVSSKSSVVIVRFRRGGEISQHTVCLKRYPIAH